MAPRLFSGIAENAKGGGLGDTNLGMFLLSSYVDISMKRLLVSREDDIEHTGLPIFGNFQVKYDLSVGGHSQNFCMSSMEHYGFCRIS